MIKKFKSVRTCKFAVYLSSLCITNLLYFYFITATNTQEKLYVDDYETTQSHRYSPIAKCKW